MKGVRPHELATVAPPHQLVHALVRNLAEAVEGQAVYGMPSATGLVSVASWPLGPSLGAEAAREQVAGGGVVIVAEVRRWSDARQALLRETALWLGIAHRLSWLRSDHHHARSRADGLRAELTTARERLAQVRDLERRRLVGAITTTTLRDLAEVRTRLRSGPARARGALDDLIDNFRTVVRGVYPAMLPDRGPREALEELAATLPYPVHFTGTLGRRVGWQVESGLYHAVAAVLNVVDGLVEVHFHRDDALRVRITAPAPADDLDAALAHDAERISVLGGAMECSVSDGTAVVRVTVADRIEPAVGPAPPLDHSPLYRQVRDLVRQGQEAVGGPEWEAVARRLLDPPRIAVVGSPESSAGVTVFPGPANRSLAQRLAADDGVDAVLCLVPPPHAFRAALRLARQRVELSESATVEQLTDRLAAWRPVLAARRALIEMTRLVRALPDGHPLRWSVDRTATEAHELAELDLLDTIERGDTKLLRGMTVDAARLLGTHGTDARTRLGLPQDADEPQIRAAAQQAATHWRTQAEHPATGGRDRLACEVLARTAEGILRS
ncbi:hypothetical protein [Actinophytocola oryzae]|uniref:Uncharacterized protein n=1 Tax=Actinophytocola oryzae TaxID=502181 RepID=A0A4R7V8A1_9PSEU|nr:hypothetical protein [Actinophytocola oryzae]TDV44935.1 hypothetical protein CLV71_113194 [Actinophytocola oryzae]